MEYLSIKIGYFLTILLPINLCIAQIVRFIKQHYSRKIMKIFNTFMIIISIVTAMIFYVFNYGNYFCFVWIGIILISLHYI